MDSQSANDIVTAVGQVYALKLRVAALERVLQSRDPALFAAWSTEIASLESEMPHQFLPQSLESLKKRLEEA